MMKMIKALFLDIDGTLVSTRTHRIPESTLEALGKAHEKGTLIYIATGRPWILIDNLSQLQELDLIEGYITMNGACCFDRKGPVSMSPMPLEDVRRMWDYTTLHGITTIVVREKDICVNMDSEALQNIFVGGLKVNVPMPEISRDQAIEQIPVYQLTSFLKVEDELEIAPDVPGLEIARWHPGFVDITVKGCTKHKGIDDMIRGRGIAVSECMAFGDGGNDIPMLRHAGIGVAMGNASSREVIEAADFQTRDVDDDGIAYALRKFGVI